MLHQVHYYFSSTDSIISCTHRRVLQPHNTSAPQPPPVSSEKTDNHLRDDRSIKIPSLVSLIIYMAQSLLKQFHTVPLEIADPPNIICVSIW